MFFRFLLATSILLLLTACEEEFAAVNPAPPILGFGDNEGMIDVTGGDTLFARVLWTRATESEQLLAFTVAGEGASESDLQILTPSPIKVPEGATEISIALKVADQPDPERLGRSGIITLLESNWARLSARDTFSFGYSVPHTVELTLWAPEIAFPQLWGYTSFNSDPVPDGAGLAAGRHFCFAYASRTSLNTIGLFWRVPGRSTNALNLHRIYADFNVGTGSANIRIPELFKLIPERAGAKRGRVEVIPQRITIVRTSSSGLPPFTVGLSGEGVYDEISGVISVGILFDESELGVAEPVLRRYKYEAEER